MSTFYWPLGTDKRKLGHYKLRPVPKEQFGPPTFMEFLIIGWLQREIAKMETAMLYASREFL